MARKPRPKQSKLSAGNISQPEIDHLERSNLEAVHDRAQAWNALTVVTFLFELNEAETDLDSFLDEETRDWLHGEVQIFCYQALKAVGSGGPPEKGRIEYSQTLPKFRTHLLAHLFSDSE